MDPGRRRNDHFDDDMKVYESIWVCYWRLGRHILGVFGFLGMGYDGDIEGMRAINFG